MTNRPPSRQLTYMIMEFTYGAFPGLIFWAGFGALPIGIVMSVIAKCVPPAVNTGVFGVFVGGFPVTMLITGASACVQAWRQDRDEAEYQAAEDERRRPPC